MTSEENDQSPLLPRQPQIDEREKAQILSETRRNLEIEETVERAVSFCPACGGETSPEKQFCPQCGRNINQNIRQVKNDDPPPSSAMIMYGAPPWIDQLSYLPRSVNPPVMPMYGAPRIEQKRNTVLFLVVGFIVGLLVISIIGLVLFALYFTF